MEPYIGEIKLFAGDFAPRGWFFCDGRQLRIHEFDRLFSLIMTYYGGDGMQTFALPDLRGRTPVQPGRGRGLNTAYELGQLAGFETTTLSAQQMPAHSHNLMSTGAAANAPLPNDNVVSVLVDKDAQLPTNLYNNLTDPAAELAPMNVKSIGYTGGSQPISLVQPILAINYIIAWDGIYPSRP